MNGLHMFRVSEDSTVSHWATAPDAETAIALVRETCDIAEVADDPVWQVELSATQLADDAPNTLWLDAPCDPEDPDVKQYMDREGYTVDLSEHPPRVTATNRTWADSDPNPFYMGSTEW